MVITATKDQLTLTGFYITISDEELGGERAPSRRYGPAGGGLVPNSAPRITGDSACRCRRLLTRSATSLPLGGGAHGCSSCAVISALEPGDEL